MRKALEIGGIVAAAVLIVFGIAAIVLAVGGRGTVSDNLKTQQITGTPDMTPKGIAPEVADVAATQAKLKAEFAKVGVKFTPSKVTAPGCSVAKVQVTDGETARCFAQYMFIHAIHGTGLVYSQMGQFQAKAGAPLKDTDGAGGTSDPQYAVTDATGNLVSNGARNTWIDQVALSTALNSSYMADQISMFGIVVGIALLLSGFGFGILAVSGALRNPDSVLGRVKKPGAKDSSTPVAPTA